MAEVLEALAAEEAGRECSSDAGRSKELLRQVLQLSVAE